MTLKRKLKLDFTVPSPILLPNFYRDGNFWYHYNLFRIVTMQKMKHHHQTGILLNKRFKWLQTSEYSCHFVLPTFHCKVSELLLLCASLGGKGHSGAQLWVVKLTGSEQDPFTELYIAYTLKTDRQIQSVAEAHHRRPGFLSQLCPRTFHREQNFLCSTHHDPYASLLVLSWPNYGQHFQGKIIPAGDVPQCVLSSH